MTPAALSASLERVADTLVLVVGAIERLVEKIRTPENSAAPSTGMPVCTCPPCIAERERGERP